MDGEMTTSTQTTETAATTSAGTSTGAAGQAAGAETGNQEKASAFKEFLDGLFGAKQEKKEPGAEEKAAEKGTEPPAGKTEEKSFSQADMDAAIEKAKQDWEAQAEEAKRQAKLSPEEKAAEETEKERRADRRTAGEALKGVICRKRQRHPWKKMVIRSAWLNCWIIPVRRPWKKSLSKLTDTFKGSLQAAGGIQTSRKDSGGPCKAASAENMLRDQIARNIRGL